MIDEPEKREPSLDELLDNTPEAVAMRRAREARAQALAREAEEASRPAKPGSTRRKLILGGALGGMAVARALGRAAGAQRRR